jgi:hypothetical protein
VKITKNTVEKLAEKIQLEIKEEEILVCLDNLKKLNKLLNKFKKSKLPKSLKQLTRINVGKLSKKDLDAIDLNKKTEYFFPNSPKHYFPVTTEIKTEI